MDNLKANFSYQKYRRISTGEVTEEQKVMCLSEVCIKLLKILINNDLDR